MMYSNSQKIGHFLTFLQKDCQEKTSESWVKDSFSGNEPYKKPKCEPSFADISEDVFVRICNFLPMRDVWNMGSVCARWYHLTRSQSICGRFDIASLKLSGTRAQQLLLTLPQCVKELKIGRWRGCVRDYTQSAPDLFYILHERFPELHTLILEDLVLAKPYREFHIRDGFVLNSKVPQELQVRRFFKKIEYLHEQDDTDFYTLVYVLRDLRILSLRSSVLTVSEVVNTKVPPSKIRILDLTKFLCATDLTIRTICQLPFLEELYLAGTSITINGVCIILKEIPRLKVLDIEDTVIGGETFEVLKYHGQSLVELYLGRTAISDRDLTDLDGEKAFPVLKKLCLHSTPVTEFGVIKLLLSVTSLSHVIITKNIKIPWFVDQRSCAKLSYADSYSKDECNHFLQNVFHGKF